MSQSETRRTPQKRLIEDALRSEPGFISAGDLHHRLLADGNRVGLATVYRQLNSLAKAGKVDSIEAEQGTIYRVCQPGEHHHHLVCDSCGRAEEIELPAENWIQSVASAHGYAPTRHVVEIFGICPACQAAKE